MRNILTLLIVCTMFITVQAGEPIIENGSIKSLEIKYGKPDSKEQVSTQRKNRNHFQRGEQFLSLGYGIPNYGGSVFKDLKTLYDTSHTMKGIGPIYLKYEYAATNHIGVGVTTRFLTSKIEYPIEGVAYDDDGNATAQDSTYTYSQSLLSIGAMGRFNYHFATTRRFDPYVGVGIGYGYTGIKIDLGGNLGGSDATIKSPSPLATEITVGARYFMTSKLAAYGEFGFSQSLINLGLSLKL